jgi:ribosome-binding factor A
MARRQRQPSNRHYPRTARVNELCREIIAEELERVDDPRLELVTVTHVDIDPDLRRGTVYFSALGDGEDEAAEALADQRVRLQGAIGRQARLKRTPELGFRVDDVIVAGARVEDILRKLRDDEPGAAGPGDTGGPSR